MGLKLLAELALDGTGFETGVNKALSTVKSAIAGAFTVGAVESLTRKTLDYAGQLNDLSGRLGVSTDFLQEFQYVAKQTGTDLEKLIKIMETLRESRDKALSGGQGAEKPLAAFQAMGIGPQQLKSERLEDLISNHISSAFQKGDVQGKIGAAWREVGGKSAGELTEAFVEGFNNLRNQAHEATRIWTEDEIQQLDDLGDSVSVMFQSLIMEWGEGLLTMIGQIRKFASSAEGLLNFLVAGTSKWNWKAIKDAVDLNPVAWINLIKTAKANPYKFDEDAAEQAQYESMEADKKRLESEAAARAALRKRRSENRTPSGDLQPVLSAPGKQSEPDALSRVGNFLGAQQSQISRIGERTNQLLTSIDATLRGMATRTTASSGDGGFPPTV